MPLKADGCFFTHIFTGRSGAALFDRAADARTGPRSIFFTGGVMPSHHLIRRHADPFEIEMEWHWSGAHHQRTAMAWLANLDAHASGIEGVLREAYANKDTSLWIRRRRWLFLATAGLFAACDSECGVSGRMKAVPDSGSVLFHPMEPIVTIP